MQGKIKSNLTHGAKCNQYAKKMRAGAENNDQMDTLYEHLSNYFNNIDRLLTPSICCISCSIQLLNSWIDCVKNAWTWLDGEHTQKKSIFQITIIIIETEWQEQHVSQQNDEIYITIKWANCALDRFEKCVRFCPFSRVRAHNHTNTQKNVCKQTLSRDGSHGLHGSTFEIFVTNLRTGAFLQCPESSLSPAKRFPLHRKSVFVWLRDIMWSMLTQHQRTLHQLHIGFLIVDDYSTLRSNRRLTCHLTISKWKYCHWLQLDFSHYRFRMIHFVFSRAHIT